MMSDEAMRAISCELVVGGWVLEPGTVLGAFPDGVQMLECGCSLLAAYRFFRPCYCIMLE